MSADPVMAATRAAGFGPEVKRRIMIGTYALSSGYYDAYYGSALKVRTLIARDFDKAYEKVDVLVSPTSPFTPWKLGEKVGDPLAMYLSDLCTLPTNLAKFDAMRFGLRVGDDGDHSAEQVMALTREAGFGAEVKRRIIIGTYALSSGYYDAYYGSAQKVRTLISRDFAAAFDAVDVLVSPSTPVTAFPIGEKVDDPLAMYMNDLCTIPSNLAGNAAMSLPIGLSPDDGLPVGLQIMAPALADDRVYRVGAALEALLQEQWGGPLLDKAPALAGAATAEVK
jgi:Asp-tRNA(Asn)/Glu-tRNA(Gln) amidotransferase A subunit family amidase